MAPPPCTGWQAHRIALESHDAVARCRHPQRIVSKAGSCIHDLEALVLLANGLDEHVLLHACHSTWSGPYATLRFSADSKPLCSTLHFQTFERTQVVEHPRELAREPFSYGLARKQEFYSMARSEIDSACPTRAADLEGLHLVGPAPGS
jgi:hypothetical protein